MNGVNFTIDNKVGKYKYSDENLVCTHIATNIVFYVHSTDAINDCFKPHPREAGENIGHRLRNHAQNITDRL